MVIIKQGAEAKLSLGEFCGKKCLIKERFVKHYRHPDLDTHLTKERMRAESKTAARCEAAGVNAPRILHMDLNERKIYMEYFEKSITAKAYINDIVAQLNEPAEQKQRINKLAGEIGTCIGKMHANNLIHGDLTTSNILLDPLATDDGTFRDYKLIMIDFGLSSFNQSSEVKGVDLYVLERALLSTHSDITYLFNTILDAYKEANTANVIEIINKFEEVRARGRKRTMVG
ncbi:EKC/KEOPS complex subunit TP53RK [Contarinia nasturtii]|uniref:EKC/KEOPS complex subunit TP53RK n=1 Tax=Contarinia nasturtii TaxID=265458 RepID=UPI0012D49FD9|nr:EKC/KEOPS complex subunit TP53RK [Contarinia nasturtii]